MRGLSIPTLTGVTALSCSDIADIIRLLMWLRRGTSAIFRIRIAGPWIIAIVFSILALPGTAGDGFDAATLEACERILCTVMDRPVQGQKEHLVVSLINYLK